MQDNPYEWMEECYEEDVLISMLDKNSEYVKDYALENLDEYDIEELREKIIDEDDFLSTITNFNYKKVTFIRDKDWFYLEWILIYSSKNIKMVDLVKKYPYSDIKTVVHKWKITRYEVTEKIKLQNKK